ATMDNTIFECHFLVLNSIFLFIRKSKLFTSAFNARLRGWQRIPLNLNTTTETTAAQWDWKRHALTVPLEAFVMCVLDDSFHTGLW
ncbi:hypothetical protein, partial [Vibrio cholerae]|uniref:hypothetical protein n=1 Tax=Vibrio cholerae TaxID=666 RepID=UPI00265927C2